MRLRRNAPTVVVLQTVVTDYRLPFYEMLRERLGSGLLILAGDSDFAPNVRHDPRAHSVPVRNLFVANRRLLWQAGALGPALRARTSVLVLNPRNVSTWLILILRRILRRRTVVWGHAWPRQGQSSRTDRVRHVLRKLADAVVVYTEVQARELRALMPGSEIVAAPNALYLAEDIAAVPPREGPRDFVCVGRLVPAKKPMLLMDAFALALPDLPEDVRIVFVGEGNLRRRLEASARASGIEHRVVFVGHESDLAALRAVFADAIASVSPGYVGLSLVQSLGFGVPMLVARDEPHAPEIEAAVEGENVWFFQSDAPGSLARLLVDMANRRRHLLEKRERIAADIRHSYSVESMVAAFVSVLRVEDSRRELDDRRTRRTAPTARR